jgi:hypothetical protein
MFREDVLFYFSNLFQQLRDVITKNLGSIGLKLSLLDHKNIFSVLFLGWYYRCIAGNPLTYLH